MKNLTPELIEKAKTAKSAEELLELAKANNVEITEDMAKTYFAQLNANGSVSDEELDAVAGGGLFCPSDEAVGAIEKGDRIELRNGKNCTCGGKIGFCVAPGKIVSEATFRCERCMMVMPKYILLGSVVRI
jgi:hypothetical protein